MKYIHLSLVGATGNITLNDSEFWNNRKVQESKKIKLIRSIVTTDSAAAYAYNLYIDSLLFHTISNIINHAILLPIGSLECEQEFEMRPNMFRNSRFSVFTSIGAISTDATTIDLVFEVM